MIYTSFDWILRFRLSQHFALILKQTEAFERFVGSRTYVLRYATNGRNDLHKQ